MEENLQYLPEALALSASTVWEEHISYLEAFDQIGRALGGGDDSFVDDLMEACPPVLPEGESKGASIERMLVYFADLAKQIVEEAQRRETWRQERDEERLINQISLQCVRDAERFIPGITIGHLITTLRAVPTNEVDIQASVSDNALYPSEIVESMMDITALFVAETLGKKHGWGNKKIEDFTTFLQKLWEDCPAE